MFENFDVGSRKDGAAELATADALRQQFQDQQRSPQSSHLTSDLLKSAALFFPGRIGLVATFCIYGLDQIKSDSSVGEKVQDFLLGGTKGSLLRGSYRLFGMAKYGPIVEGIALGASSRFIDLSFDPKSYIDPLTHQSSWQTGFSNAYAGTFNLQSALTDGVIFGTDHFALRNFRGFSGKALEIDLRKSMLVTGTTFGITSGAVSEVMRQHEAGKGYDLTNILQSAGREGLVNGLASIPGGLRANQLAGRLPNHIHDASSSPILQESSIPNLDQSELNKNGSVGKRIGDAKRLYVTGVVDEQGVWRSTRNVRELSREARVQLHETFEKQFSPLCSRKIMNPLIESLAGVVGGWESVNKTAPESVIQQRRQEWQDAINFWAKNHKYPEFLIKFEDSGTNSALISGAATYSGGMGMIEHRRADAYRNHESSGIARFVSYGVHEVNHGIQDYYMTRKAARKALSDSGLSDSDIQDVVRNKNLSPKQIEQIGDCYLKYTKRTLSKNYLDRVLDVWDGKKLTPAEDRRADQFAASFRNRGTLDKKYDQAIEQSKLCNAVIKKLEDLNQIPEELVEIYRRGPKADEYHQALFGKKLPDYRPMFIESLVERNTERSRRNIREEVQDRHGDLHQTRLDTYGKYLMPHEIDSMYVESLAYNRTKFHLQSLGL